MKVMESEEDRRRRRRDKREIYIYILHEVEENEGKKRNPKLKK